MDGIIIYKNKTAAEIFKRIRRGMKIEKFLDENNIIKYNTIISENKTETVKIKTDTVYQNAVVYRDFEKNNIYFIFPIYLQFTKFGSPAVLIKNIILENISDILNITKNSNINIELKTDEINILRNKIIEIINKIDENNLQQNQFNLNKILKIFRAQTMIYANEAKYDFHMDIINIPQAEYYKMDFLYVLSELIIIIYILCELTSSKKITSSVEIDELDLVFKFKTKIKNPPFYIKNAENILKIAKYYNCDITDILIFEALINLQNHKILYSITEKNDDNFIINFLVPLPFSKSFGMILHQNDDPVMEEKEKEANDIAAVLLKNINK